MRRQSSRSRSVFGAMGFVLAAFLPHLVGATWGVAATPPLASPTAAHPHSAAKPTPKAPKSKAGPAKPSKAPHESSIASAVKGFESKTRDVVQRREEILAACELRPGMSVADVGAGTGFFTRLMAGRVGPSGQVYAVEVNQAYLEHISATCRQQKLDNVLPVLGTQRGTNLPRQAVDLVFICDTYHHFEQPQEMLASIFEALRPGGRIVLVDFYKRGNMASHVRADKDQAIAAFAAAGFVFRDVRDLGSRQYLARFQKRAFRPPAVPLVAHDPYFSIWSFADQLAADWPRHWTGAIHALSSMIRVDGKTYRLMGLELRDAPAMRQTGLEVLPLRTLYDFEEAGVHVRLTFTSPLLPEDLELVGRPVTYLTWEVWSTDGRPHEVSLYYDNSAELVVNEASQAVGWSRPEVPGLVVLRMGSADQPVLQKKGDDLRIDWGYLYVAAPREARPTAVISDHHSARKGFAAGKLPQAEDAAMPRPANRDCPVAAFRFDLGAVGPKPASRWLMLAYDDLYAIEYLGTRLRPYWRRHGAEAPELLETAAGQYRALAARVEEFDRQLVADLVRVGGRGYADLCALAYRQALAGHKLVAAPDGRPMLFPKENFSNGCIGTVDVIYPAAPVFALLNNELLKATVTPVLQYAASPRWKFPFAPHDLGTYPLANGQVYGGGQTSEKNQMPVEESGNLLIVAALIAHVDGNIEYLKPYWPLLQRWAEYLKAKGLDPENQLCTDDFAGHLAHNANLSVKAILALGCYSRLCQMAGNSDEAAQYRRLAEDFARQWEKLADDGDHYRLAFDRPGTWSQKYNLVWDKLLGLRLFGPHVVAKEVAFYKRQLQPFGLPLDNRENYTKTDWEVWTATLANYREDFDTLMRPVYAFLSATQPRVPLTDWYFTRDARLRGFRARPVIGGVFIKMLDDPAVWKKWSSRKPAH